MFNVDLRDPFDLSDLEGLNIFVDDDEDAKSVRLYLEPEQESAKWTDEATRQAIYQKTLPDGHYAYSFQFVNPLGDVWNSTSNPAMFTVKNGNIYAVAEPDLLKDEEITELLLEQVEPQDLKD